MTKNNIGLSGDDAFARALGAQEGTARSAAIRNTRIAVALGLRGHTVLRAVASAVGRVVNRLRHKQDLART